MAASCAPPVPMTPERFEFELPPGSFISDYCQACGADDREQHREDCPRRIRNERDFFEGWCGALRKLLDAAVRDREELEAEVGRLKKEVDSMGALLWNLG